MTNQMHSRYASHVRAVLIAFTLLAGFGPQARAQARAQAPSAAQAAVASFPNRRVRLIVPTSTGAGTDFAARLFAQIASEAWKQPVFVDNRSGASGMIGLDLLAQAPPDGYTLEFMSVSQFLNAILQKKYVFDSKKDFTPISNLASTPFILVANPRANISSLQQLIERAKAEPNVLNYSSGGTGGITNLAMEFFLKKAGIKIVHVPYKGSGPAVEDLLAGHVQLSFSTPPAVMPDIKAGSLRAVALAAEQRSALAPGIPTFAEQGLPGISLGTWYGLFGPANMPPALVEKIARTLTAAAGTVAQRQRMARDGLDPVLSDPADFARFLTGERARWTDVASQIGFKP